MMLFFFRFSLASLFITIATTTLSAQFVLNGSASTTNDSCYQMTAAVNAQVGAIWNAEKINLNESFDVAVDIFVGCADDLGADGLVFGLQPISTTISTDGGGIGFLGVVPSLGVEFDTFLNGDFGDPAFDHITVVRDGVMNHNLPGGALAGPVQASATSANIEDCQFHPVRFNWNADTQTLSIYYDCELRLTYTDDIVNNIFGGDPEVFWGFTAATGGLNNAHEICFSYTTFLDQLVDQTICPGEETQLEATGGVSYNWTPGTGLSDSTIANPIASPTETTLYTVEIVDDCGIPFFDDVLLTVDNNQFEATIATTPEDLENVMFGDELALTTTVTPTEVGPFTYSWFAAQGSTFTAVDSASTTVTIGDVAADVETLQVLVTSEDGCVQAASIDLEITAVGYAVPEIFSPNGDSLNDRFGLFTRAPVSTFRCEVYNRWGRMVYESEDALAFWDGTFEGEAAPADVYLYQMNFQIGNEQYEEQGGLTLVR